MNQPRAYDDFAVCRPPPPPASWLFTIYVGVPPPCLQPVSLHKAGARSCPVSYPTPVSHLVGWELWWGGGRVRFPLHSGVWTFVFWALDQRNCVGKAKCCLLICNEIKNRFCEDTGQWPKTRMLPLASTMRFIKYSFGDFLWRRHVAFLSILFWVENEFIFV